MSSISIVSRFLAFWRPGKVRRVPDLHTLWLQPGRLPWLVQESPLAQEILDLLGPLGWDRFPERNLQRNWGQAAIPYSAFTAACLVKIELGIRSMAGLRACLGEQPALTWLLGFRTYTLPTYRHFTRLLRKMPNETFQFLLRSSVDCLLAELGPLFPNLGECIAMDTKHILAFVKENNPKAYIEDRFNKTKQPKGDPDCKLGCKRRRNRHTDSESSLLPSPNAVHPGEFYWGYASGVAVVKVPSYGEFILAELTQPFDSSDVSYFFPLMKQVEQRLGFKPKYGALDAAYDAFYVYDYFHDAGGFAAVPFSEKGGYRAGERRFSKKGLPLCAAGKPMPQAMTFTDRTRAIFEHERGKYVCPLLFPKSTGEICPTNHPNWLKGGCTVDMPTSLGARLRYTLDRESELYKQVYRQRTATERIFSQAKELGIERPILRNGQAIANLNTLTYTVINLRLLKRIRQRKALS